MAQYRDKLEEVWNNNEGYVTARKLIAFHSLLILRLAMDLVVA